jgi:hypothetical protein
LLKSEEGAKQRERLTRRTVFPEAHRFIHRKEWKFMGGLIRKLAIEGLRAGKRVSEIDLTNPLTQDTVSFVIDVLKEVIKPF